MNIDQRQQKAINDLRRNKVGLRYGTVVADPDGAGRLCVNLGNSDEMLIDCKSVGGASVAVGDRVPVLVRGNDILVLGGVGDGAGGGGGGPFQPLDADLTTLAGMPTGLASSIVGMGPTAQNILDANAPADVRAATKDTSYTPVVTVYGHSINYTGSSDGTRGIAHRLGTIMSTDIQMMAVGGSILSANLGGFGTGLGGWEHVYRRTDTVPGTVSVAGIGAPRRGPTSVFTGVNDIGTMQQTTGAVSGSMTVADYQIFQHSLRAVISRFRAANLWQEDDGVTKSTAGKYKRTSGSAVITDVASFANVTEGLWITGTGIPAAAKVLSIDLENKTLTMTANATSGTATDTALTFSTVAYDTAYTRSGATPTDTAVMNGSGGYYGTTTTVNNKVSLAVPTRFNGGTATVAFLVDDSGHGAVWTIALDGTTVGTVDTRNQNVILNGPVPFWNTCVFRVTGMPPGAQTITATPTTIGGANVAYFDCWWIEADDPPPICLPLQYHALYAYDDDDVDRLNDATSAVAAEFDDNVFTVETGDLMSDSSGTPDPESFNDAIHPNDRGHALIAARIADAFASRARSQTQQSRGAHNLPFLSRNPSDSVRNLLQPDVPNATALTLRATNSADSQSADLFSIENFDGSTQLLKVGPTGAVTGKGAFNIGGADIGTGAGGGLIANPGLSNYVALGYKGLFVTGPGITFGTALDTNIYRESANKLATDDDFHVGGNLTVDGTAPAGSTAAGFTATGISGADERFLATSCEALDAGLVMYASGDTVARVSILRSGLFIGPGGSSAADINLSRTGTAAGTFTGALTITGATTLSGTTALNDTVTIADAKNIVLNTSTGTRIGTGTTQKLGFFNATPVAQQSSTTDIKDVLVNMGFLADSGATPLNLDGGAFTTTGAVAADHFTSTGTAGADDRFVVTSAEALDQNLAVYAAGDTVARVAILRTGIYLGPGSSTAADVNWSRTGTAATQITGQLTVTTGLTFPNNVDVVIGTGGGTTIATGTTQKLGFWGATPIVRGTAFTQTYSTASHTHANITASNPPAGGTGATAGAYDTAANRNAMITSLTNNIADVANVKQVLNGLIDDLQAIGLIA